jgi:hypothetical protein
VAFDQPTIGHVEEEKSEYEDKVFRDYFENDSEAYEWEENLNAKSESLSDQSHMRQPGRFIQGQVNVLFFWNAGA